MLVGVKEKFYLRRQLKGHSLRYVKYSINELVLIAMDLGSLGDIHSFSREL